MESEFLGLTNITDPQKKLFYDILNSYQLMRNYLHFNLGLKVPEKKLSGVIGMLVERNTLIESGILMSYYFSMNLTARQKFFENFDWTKLNSIASNMLMVSEKLLKIKSVNFGMKFLIWLRYADWARLMVDIAKVGLYLLAFLSVLYVLVATEWGRGLTWEFLNVYSQVIKLILIFFLLIALVVIVSMVSFMYLENKNNKEKGNKK